MMQKEDFSTCKIYLNTQKMNSTKVRWIRIEKDNPKKIRVYKTLKEMERFEEKGHYRQDPVFLKNRKKIFKK